MANCLKFQNLTPLEKAEYMGKLTHACMSDDLLFESGKKLIEEASEKGLFNNMKIINDLRLPPDTPDAGHSNFYI